ncbi:hypothetical protein BgiBS90_026614, partial [Biomphalaria glabrata]
LYDQSVANLSTFPLPSPPTVMPPITSTPRTSELILTHFISWSTAPNKSKVATVNGNHMKNSLSVGGSGAFQGTVTAPSPHRPCSGRTRPLGELYGYQFVG